MIAMSRRTEEVLEQLHVIARGDTLLVQRALRIAGPKLDDIVDYIERERGA